MLLGDVSQCLIVFISALVLFAVMCSETDSE